MNYKKIHDEIISKAKARLIISGYFERHHIVPRSMGGNDEESNIVNLTAREHYLIHWLLFKIYRNKETCFAWYRMTHCNKNAERYNSRTFDYAKKHRSIHVSKLFSGKKLSKEHIEKLSKAKRGKKYSDIGREESPLKGRTISEDHKRKVGEASKGRKYSESTRKLMSEKMIGEKNHRYGKKVSDETREKLRMATKNARKTPMSEETRRKLSDSMKAAIEKKKLAIRANSLSKN